MFFLPPFSAAAKATNSRNGVWQLSVAHCTSWEISYTYYLTVQTQVTRTSVLITWQAKILSTSLLQNFSWCNARRFDRRAKPRCKCNFVHSNIISALVSNTPRVSSVLLTVPALSMFVLSFQFAILQTFGRGLSWRCAVLAKYMIVFGYAEHF